MKKVTMFLIAFVLCGLMTNAQVDLQNGLVAYYPFNGNANDESGNGNNGTVNGATLTTDRFGNENKAFSFNGIDNFIEIQDNSLLRPQQITISAFILPLSENEMSIVSKSGNDASNEMYHLCINSPNPQGSHFTIKQNSNCIPGSGWVMASYENNIPINNWHHLVGLYSNNSVKFYLDGVLVAENTTTTNFIDDCAGAPLRFGLWWGNSLAFNGKIDDIRIYNRALNSDEIAILSSNKSISTSNQNATVGRTIEIPVLTSELTTSDNVIAYQFDYNYDNTKLEYVGNTLAGTLAESGTLQVNPTTNKLSFAWARGTALVGTGEILKLQFKVLAVGETTPTITNALYNTESVTATNGTITAVYKYGDIDANDFVQAYDAALAIQYSVGLDPLPTIDPLPWENWRVIVADVDGTAGVTANDASEILKYTVGLISTFPVEGGKKSLKSGNADINITLVGNELLFQPTGELYGLNVNVTENISVLGQPQFLNANMLNATNINANTYSIGLATANAPTENETFMKIPVTLTQNTNITFDLIINTTVKSVTVSGTTGIVTINDKAVSIYPNPTNSILYVNGLQNANVQIFDLTGKLLINQQNADNQIDVSNLQNGIYSIKITNESGTVIRKFVKQ